MFKPALVSSLKTYTRQTFLSDLFAGLTVGVVAIPLAMAFAIACGLSPSQGLVTAIVAGFLISLFSGSKYQIGGPTGAFVIIIMGVLEQYHASGLLICTLMAGVFLIIFGVCRMGALIRFIPFPVTTGFTSGIAVVIFSTQIKDIFGLTIAEKIPGDFIDKWACYFQHFHTVNWAALGLAAGTVILTLLSRRFWPKGPAMLVGMLGMTAVSVAFTLPVATIGQAFGSLPNTLPMPSLPHIEWHNVGALTAPAFTIALLAAIESLLSASVADGMTGGRHKPNMELIAQGIGNIGSALFGGIPATGAIARTATNIKAGAKSPVSGMIHSLTLLAILMAFAQYAQQIPLAVLAGILTVVCYNMSEMHTFRRLLKGPRQDAAVLVITFLLTVFVDLVVAVEVGVVLAAPALHGPDGADQRRFRHQERTAGRRFRRQRRPFHSQTQYPGRSGSVRRQGPLLLRSGGAIQGPGTENAGTRYEGSHPAHAAGSRAGRHRSERPVRLLPPVPGTRLYPACLRRAAPAAGCHPPRSLLPGIEALQHLREY